MMLLLLLYIFLTFHPNAATYSHCNTKTTLKTFERCTTLPTQKASIAWAFHRHNATLDLVFLGNFISPSGWIGWGINPNSPEMTGGTRALIAFPDPDSGQLVLLPYILDPTVKLQKQPLLSRPLDLHILSSSATLYGGRTSTIQNGATINIYVTIKLEQNKTKLHFIWNRGLYVQGYSPTIHETNVNDLSSIATIDVLSGATTKSHNDITQLKIAHGIINTISWGILLPIGAVTARFFRHIPAAGPGWFYAHAGIQISAIFLGTIGFAIGVKLGELSADKVYGVHRKLGLATFCLGWLQTLVLMFRPKATHKFRKYWKSYHHFVGYSCVVLGVINVFQGFTVMGVSYSYVNLGYCLCLSTLIGICITLEVNSWVMFSKKAEEENAWICPSGQRTFLK